MINHYSKNPQKLRKYAGVFNWYGEIHTFHTSALSEGQVRTFMCKQLAECLKLEHSAILIYFNGSKNNYEIKEMK